ncbi:arsenate reductase ArsC [Rhizobium helianthi]|uniref:Arsenate reductase ArsC n=1 Tax=Rhizobium helianthi TaxID=1132695 RepID=A0ABW4M646_9HYPH
MTDKIYNVLFLCTGNSARSIMAESILAKEGQGRFRSYSAGSQPKGEVHPLSLKTLAALGYAHEGFRSKSWDEFAGGGQGESPVEFDFIFTVCDNAAGEACPVWVGHPVTAHWGVEDPAAFEGTEAEKLQAFAKAARYLRNRIAAFVNLPLASLDKLTLNSKLHEIGSMEGATTGFEKA